MLAWNLSSRSLRQHCGQAPSPLKPHHAVHSPPAATLPPLDAGWVSARTLAPHHFPWSLLPLVKLAHWKHSALAKAGLPEASPGVGLPSTLITLHHHRPSCSFCTAQATTQATNQPDCQSVRPWIQYSIPWCVVLPLEHYCTKNLYNTLPPLHEITSHQRTGCT